MLYGVVRTGKTNAEMSREVSCSAREGAPGHFRFSRNPSLIGWVRQLTFFLTVKIHSDFSALCRFVLDPFLP